MTKEKKGEQIDYEIDLFKLFKYFWEKKILIVKITAFFTLIGLAYALLTPSTYEARVNIYPPSLIDIRELQNFGTLKSSQTQNQVFKDFISILKSYQFRKNFLMEEGSIESLSKKEIISRIAIDRLANMIRVDESKKGEKKASLKIQYKNADIVAQYANKLINFAIKQYREDISQLFDYLKDQKIKNLLNKKNVLILSDEERLKQEIILLKEAYRIADKLDINEPQESEIPNQKNMVQFIGGIQEMRNLYSQGTRALGVEIENITQRDKPLTINNDVIGVEQELLDINQLSFDASKVMPITIELDVESSGYIIKPKRTLIVLLSGVVGGFLATIFLLFQYAVGNRKAKA